MAKQNQQTETSTLLTMRDVMLEAVAAQAMLDDGKDSQKAVSQHLMVSARRYIDGATNKLDVEMFLTACKQEENYIKSDAAGANKVDRIPRCWTQAKSNIKAAAEFDISPADHKTEASMRKALNEARKAAKDDAIAQEAAGIEDTKLVVRSVDNEIKGVLAALADVYDALDDDKALSMKQDLVKLHAKYKGVFQAIVKGEVRKETNSGKQGKTRDSAGQPTDTEVTVING